MRTSPSDLILSGLALMAVLLSSLAGPASAEGPDATVNPAIKDGVACDSPGQ